MKKTVLICLLCMSAIILCACGCSHEESHIITYKEASCNAAGYSGDLYCEKVLEKGRETSPAGIHTEALTNNVEATCFQEGYSGDTVCKSCKEVLQYGEAVPALEHKYIRNSKNERATCSLCQSVEPGLYADAELLFTWDILLSHGYVEVENVEYHDSFIGDNGIYNEPSTYTNTLMNVAEELQGCLVVDSKIEALADSAFEECEGITEVYLPASITEIPFRCFVECKSLQSVHAAGSLTEIGNAAFMECVSLKSFSIPEGITQVSHSLFRNCSGLENVQLPSSIQLIDNYGFCGCTSLKNIDLPEGLVTINVHGFSYSGLEGITLPSTVQTLGYETFSHCKDLVSADLSKSQVNSIEEYTFFPYEQSSGVEIA